MTEIHDSAWQSKLVSKVRDELSGWQRLRPLLETEEPDPQAILDTLEGETDLYESLLVVAEQIDEHEAAIAGIEKWAETLARRKSRHEKSVDTLRNVILSAMQKAEIKTIPGATVTLTTKATAPKLIVEDEARVPAKYWKAQDPKLDRKALAATLKDCAVPGATLSNGGITLEIRRA